MYYNRKKELLKNIIICGTILAIAVISTYYIYNKFDHSELVDYTSESLDITYKEDNGDKVTITSVSPVTDSVGLSTKAHTITIKNNLTESAKYIIKLTTDIDEMIKDDCAEYQIPIEELKVAIRYSSGNTDIYNLADLTDGILVNGKVPALEEEKYTIRVWVSNESSLPMGSSLHYHGIIEVIEVEK